MVTWHLTTKLVPAKCHERVTFRKLCRQTENSSLLPAKCWPLLHVIGGGLMLSLKSQRVFKICFCFVLHLMTVSLGNSEFCFPRISMFLNVSLDLIIASNITLLLNACVRHTYQLNNCAIWYDFAHWTIHCLFVCSSYQMQKHGPVRERFEKPNQDWACFRISVTDWKTAACFSSAWLENLRYLTSNIQTIKYIVVIQEDQLLRGTVNSSTIVIIQCQIKLNFL